MANTSNKLAIGFIVYGDSSAKYLEHFLPSLIGQTDCAFNLMCIDNSETSDNANKKIIENYQQIDYIYAGQNLGFAKAFNQMFSKALANGSDYFLALNPDMVLEAGAVKKLMAAIENDSSLGSVCPKILRWDFVNHAKIKIIDSCGIVLRPGLQFADSGQGMGDDDFIADRQIIGPSGAAALYRLSALEKVKEGEQYFDEAMFMYKEDCDLAYRLNLAGFKSACVSDAVIYHDRSVSSQGEGSLAVIKNRLTKDRQIKKWSFLNQQIIFVKFWGTLDLFGKLQVIWHQLKILVYITLFEQYLFLELGKLKLICPKLKRYHN